jgi:3-deoxy-manno-octulosonate cytidylyltransferase (CMP-KDO synthetase)
MNTLIVIPARHASSRLPGKPLIELAGKTLIERVYRQCAKVKGVSSVLVATDHDGIFEEVASFGGEVLMTKKSHRSGTERVAEAARKKRANLVINVQGDEPLLDPRAIEKLIKGMQRDDAAQIATLASPITEKSDFLDPNVVKTVLDEDGWALYFSRSPIPYWREDPTRVPRPVFRHIGIYGYRNEALQKWVRMAPTRLEKLEKLEQLRALENGLKIKVFLTNYVAIGVDTPSDVKKVERILAKRSRAR